jgi:hypothetical protein
LHVHRPVVDLTASALYAARAAEKAAELKKAADVRRKLMKAGAGIDGDSSDFGSFLVEKRSGGGSRQDDEEGETHSSGRASARPRNRGNSDYEAEAKPLSIWA